MPLCPPTVRAGGDVGGIDGDDREGSVRSAVLVIIIGSEVDPPDRFVVGGGVSAQGLLPSVAEKGMEGCNRKSWPVYLESTSLGAEFLQIL